LWKGVVERVTHLASSPKYKRMMTGMRRRRRRGGGAAATL
jgi:hypothetical protein